MRSNRHVFQKREGKIEWEEIIKEMSEENFLEVVIMKGPAYCPVMLMQKEKEKKTTSRDIIMKFQNICIKRMFLTFFGRKNIKNQNKRLPRSNTRF